MRRTIPAVAVILLATAGCGASTSHGDSTSHPSVTKQAANPKTTAAAKSCPPTRNVIVWTKAPGVPDSAQVIGSYTLTCESTFKWLQHSSPTDAGYCTEAAYASDNPGYNANAQPARRLKDVQAMVGPAC